MHLTQWLKYLIRIKADQGVAVVGVLETIRRLMARYIVSKVTAPIH